MQHWRLRAEPHIGLHLRGDEEEVRVLYCMRKKFNAALTEFHILGISPGTVLRFISSKRLELTCAQSDSGENGNPDYGVNKTEERDNALTR